MTVTEGGFAMPAVGRREALGAAGIAACGLALAGCGTGDAAAEPVVKGIKGQVIAKTADVPVGGGTVVREWKIVVTQPSEGVYKAYSAACPHRGLRGRRAEGQRDRGARATEASSPPTPARR